MNALPVIVTLACALSFGTSAYVLYAPAPMVQIEVMPDGHAYGVDASGKCWEGYVEGNRIVWIRGWRPRVRQSRTVAAPEG